MPEFENKTALVTGASRGIGRATALKLARAGANVLLHYGRSAHEADSLVDAIRAEGGRANAVSADLGTPDGASLLAKQVRSIVGDRLDVLVLNAGISKAALIADYTVEDFDSHFATNVRGRNMPFGRTKSHMRQSPPLGASGVLSHADRCNRGDLLSTFSRSTQEFL